LRNDPANGSQIGVVRNLKKYMKAIEIHRQTWQGKSDEWLFERL